NIKFHIFFIFLFANNWVLTSHLQAISCIGSTDENNNNIFFTTMSIWQNFESNKSYFKIISL
ncbi:hypothetical protein J7L68_09750, partial [bacterium]|nr:hypothetical protein [bacterium]